MWQQANDNSRHGSGGNRVGVKKSSNCGGFVPAEQTVCSHNSFCRENGGRGHLDSNSYGNGNDGQLPRR